VEEYFNKIRPAVFPEGERDEAASEVDALMHNLLLLCHKHGTVKRYRSLLIDIRKALILVDARTIATGGTKSKQTVAHEIDEKIVLTLDSIMPSAALSYRQALIDLEADERYSWRGPATDLRETLRETLDYLAPDKEVQSMAGYKQMPDTHGPTMKQKVRFIMKSRGVSKSSSAPAESAVECIESGVGSFVRSVYTRSSLSTHTPTDKKEVLRIRDFVRVVLSELLEIQA